MSQIAFIESIPTAGAIKIASGHERPASNGPSQGVNLSAIELNTPYIISKAIPAIRNAGVSDFVIVPLPSIARIPTIAPRKASTQPTHTPFSESRIRSWSFWML